MYSRCPFSSRRDSHVCQLDAPGCLPALSWQLRRAEEEQIETCEIMKSHCTHMICTLVLTKLFLAIMAKYVCVILVVLIICIRENINALADIQRTMILGATVILLKYGVIKY